MTMRKNESFQDATSQNYTKKAEVRLALIKKYDDLIKAGCPQEIALRTLQISRRTIYRWKKLYRLEGFFGLVEYSTRPNKVRKPEWTPLMKERIWRLRLANSVYGKDKIAKFYFDEYGEAIPVNTVAKILKVLIKERKIKLVSDITGKHMPTPRVFNNHAKRLPKGAKAQELGDLIQIDHMTVYVPGVGERKQFNAICPISKIIVTKVYEKATYRSGKDFLYHLIEKLPFAIRSIQVDGGGEFMNDFEYSCAREGIFLFVLPPRSPKLNGTVERCNGTFRQEFYSLHDHFKSEEEFKKKLDVFTHFYNTVRPHKNLRLLTPCQYLERIN